MTYTSLSSLFFPLSILFFVLHASWTVDAFNPFTGASRRIPTNKPCLILVGGPPGTGKSTFGMELALDQGILKCVSTDTVRAVMRSFVAPEVSPALHRSSYAAAYEDDDPVRSWRETCSALNRSVESLVNDAIERKVSLVVEGVHVMPSNELIDKYKAAGGVAVGVLLQVTDADAHKRMLQRRGFLTGNTKNENAKIESLDRVRQIQDEMIRLADASGWVRIEQKTQPDPLEIVSSTLFGDNNKVEDAGVDLNQVNQQVIYSLPKSTPSPSASTPSVDATATTTEASLNQEEEVEEEEGVDNDWMKGEHYDHDHDHDHHVTINGDQQHHHNGDQKTFA